MLRECAARNGAAFADWHAISAGRADLLRSDGYHLNPAGAHQYAALSAGLV